MAVNEKIRDVIRYILLKYPDKCDLNKTRLTKLVYLIDWEMVKKHNELVSGIKWYFDNYGPYVPDVMKEASSDDTIEINEGVSTYGGPKYTFQLVKSESNEFRNLSDQEREVIDNVIVTTKDMSFNDFINYVYSTPPVSETPKYQILDLKKFR